MKAKMKIGIIDADLLDSGTRHPNLALMKISAFYKSLGHDVELLKDYEQVDQFEKLFMSKVFSYTKVPPKVLLLPTINYGGTGFYENGGDDLPREIEHHKPDYDLYKDFINSKLAEGKSLKNFSDYLHYSIGFTTRGCFRKCEFCVNKKYDTPSAHSPVKEFYDSSKPYIYLWDDNFLAFNGWEKILDELTGIGKPFQFRQGLDIRLMNSRKAEKLSKANYHGDFIFAFDHLKDKKIIEKNLKLWRRYTSRTTKLYVLCAYESQDEHDIVSVFERIKILMRYGCLPYIMRYESYLDSKWKTLYIQLARWCNQPQFFKKKSFRQFCEANQFYHKNKNTYCAAYSSMCEFETEFPKIAEQYFGLRYEEENRYSFSYGYGRKYAHKQDCNVCAGQEQTWINAKNEELPLSKLLSLYFNGNIDLQCLTYSDSQCTNISTDAIATWFIKQLIQTRLTDIFDILCNSKIEQEVHAFNIPQYSNFEDAYIETPQLLWQASEGISFELLGKHLGQHGKVKNNEIARRKYGENHSKLATLLDLAVISKPNNSFQVILSVLGNASRTLSRDDKKKLVLRLIFRIPIIQNALYKASVKKILLVDELKCLAKATQTRRKSNISDLLRLLQQNAEENSSLARALNNIDF